MFPNLPRIANLIGKSAPLASITRQAETQGFGTLALRGLDVHSAISQAANSSILSAALQVAERTGERFWEEQIARRTCAVDRSGLPRLRLALFTALHGELDETKTLLFEIQRRPVSNPKYEHLRRTIDGILLANDGNVDDAMEKFSEGPPQHNDWGLRRAAIATSQSLIKRCNLNAADLLLQRLSDSYPSNLTVCSLKLRCKLLLGQYSEVRRLIKCGESLFEGSAPSERRAFAEAATDALDAFGWYGHLLDYLHERITDDPTHWFLYGRASMAARMTSRDSEYAALIENIPGQWRDGVEGLATRAHWLVDENRMDEASAVVERMRLLSAGWYLGAKLYHDLHTSDRPELEQAIGPFIQSGVPSLDAAITFSIYTYYFNSSRERIGQCLAALIKFERTAPTNISFWQIYLRCLIAIGENIRAMELYRGLPLGLAKSAALAPIQMWSDAAEGRHQEARKGWQEYIRVTRHRAVNAPSSYPRTVRSRYNGRPQDILLFSTVFNGQSYLDWFLSYYRTLGVDHFFIIDNGSTDGSLEKLHDEPDVSVFSNPDSFASSAFGVLWINHLMQRYGVGRWSFHVDFDEGFVFPACDAGRTLRELLRYCDDHGFRAVSAIELDMYPERLGDSRAGDPFSECCFFDIDYEFIPCELPPYVLIQGGLRRRLTNVGVLMQKTPLVLVSSDMRYLECNHGTTHLPMADVSAALLHYKFIGGMKERVDEAVQRREHFGGAIFYRRLDKAVASNGWDISLVTKFSRRYDRAKTLVDLGLMATSPRWEAYLQHPVNSMPATQTAI